MAQTDSHRIVITVLGKNRAGIVAAISKILGEANVDIRDITQSIIEDIFTMTMLADMSESPMDFTALQESLAAGGEAVAAQIGEIMGVSAGAAVKQIAQVHCTGCGQHYKQYTYVGIHDCVAASKLPGGGDLGCAYGCLGLGSCEKACPFDAIHVIDGVARVDEEKCKACNKCVDICPRHIIALEPYKTKRHVTIPCSSHDKGVDARKVCDNGCIGCSLCAKSCPKEAITMVNNLAVIDYEKCIGCGICAQKCPRKLITVDGKVPEVKPAAPKAAPAAAVKPAAPAAEKPAAEAAAAPKAEAPAEPKE